MRRLAIVSFLSVLPLLSPAGTNDVAGRFSVGTQLTMKPQRLPGFAPGTTLISSGGYTLQTARARMSEPMVRFSYCVEAGDTSRRTSGTNIPVPDSEKDARAIARKAWNDYGVASFDQKAKLLVWRIELQYKGELLDYVTNVTEQKLKQYGLSADW